MSTNGTVTRRALVALNMQRINLPPVINVQGPAMPLLVPVGEQPLPLLIDQNPILPPSLVDWTPGKTATRLLVFMLHPRDAKELVIPEKSNDAHP